MRWATFAAALAAVTIAFAQAPDARAQSDYPNKPIRIVVPYPPGGATDITVRVFQPALAEILGQPIVVENKPGGATNIAAESVARAAPDGYSLYVSNFASHAINRWLFAKLPFDPVTDFTHVAMLVRGPMFLCVKPDSPFKNVKELVDYARKNPGKLTYGSTGNGSPNHISGELLKHLAKIDVVHVPYTGSAQMYNDLLAGQIDFGFDAAVIQFHRSGKLRCLGVASTFKWPTDPELPIIAENGVPGFDLVSFFGIVGPKGLPEPIVKKLNAAFVEVAKRPDTAEKLKVTSVVPFPASLEETRAFM
ncbi:MAG: tripartite tricarboxylate transporter substrate binding protein, partial [Rhodospirillales bacterium]|nr:tripartite tricarboxylate transporter substrate binding protein [Rhodospirillales bacterium]